MNSKIELNADYNKQLLGIRDSISEIDESLISLIAKRRKLSIDVANIKQAIDKPLRDQLREKELLESLVEKASLLNIESRYITKIFTAIIEDSVRQQQDYVQAKVSPATKDSAPKSVAVLGGLGAYSHLAAKQFFSKSENQYDACDSFDEIIFKVESGKAQYGVIPIENTTSGGITEVYDLLLSSKLQIVGEEKLAINHCLIAKKQVELSEITTIMAHPQAAKQCSQDLAGITNAKISLCESTAHALNTVSASNNSTTAAIASEQAAELFDLGVLQKNIANQNQNFTRFMVLAKKAIPVSLTVQSKTTIALSTGQQPGSLAKVLALFQNANIPLTKLESRPIPEKPWEQLFYIDLQGNLEEPFVAEALTSLSKLCKFLKVFGSYPSENIIATQISSDRLAHASLKRSELNERRPDLSTKDNIVSTSNLLTTKVAPQATSDFKESVIDLSGTLIGKNHFILSAQITNSLSDKQLENQLNNLAESGLTSFWLQNFLDFEIDVVSIGLNAQVISRNSAIANQHQLSFIYDVKSPQQLESVVANKGIPKIPAIRLDQIELLDSAGNQNSPIIIQQAQNQPLDELLNIADYILAKGNQQVVLELELDCSKSTSYSIANIAKLKNATHLPIVVSLIGENIEIKILTSLIISLRALGINGVVLSLKNDAVMDKDNKLMITAKDFAVIMTKI